VPELPEAETIVRGLRPLVVGRRIRGIEVIHADVLRQPRRRFADRVRGATIVDVGRRGKNVIIGLDGDRVVAVNLGMTGRLLPIDRADRKGDWRHPAVRFRFEGGGMLVFDDTRRFGTVEGLSREEWETRSARMGPEPLEASFTARGLHSALSSSRSPIRSWLLDQRKIAGVGNIYASEALHLAGIHPKRQARAIDRARAAALHKGIRRVLSSAIGAGGTTIRDYRTALGDAGRYARRLLVYGRDGEPCGRCGAEVRRIVFGGRSAFYCPVCQPEVPAED
jgi:formamidopyrimidine-DNA glycosylase